MRRKKDACGLPAKVADHYPRRRADLVAAHVPNPDSPDFLRGLCKSCHSSLDEHL